jgi:transposase
VSAWAKLSRKELLVIVTRQAAQLQALSAELRSALARIAELEAKPGGGSCGKTPDFVKANVPKEPESGSGPDAPRKKRTESFVRHREEPTQTIEIGAVVCPDCGHKLSGGSVVSKHQVIDIPRVDYEVTEYHRLRRWCGHCGRYVEPPPLEPDQAVDQSRFSPRVMSLVAELVTVNRMTHRAVREYLASVHGLHVSEGAISAMLHTVAEHGRAVYEALVEEARESPVVHADETGFRENGRNGYIWAVVTKLARVFSWDASRARRVITDFLGGEFSSILVTDFYSAYTGLECPHQWCWVHLLRAAREAREKNPDDRVLRAWVEKLKAFYQRAGEVRDRVACRPEAVRAEARGRVEAKLLELADRPVSTTGPARKVGNLIRRFAHELLTFIEHPEVPPDNNAAERAIRPVVVARKVSGGTRSPRGTETKMILLSLFGTWGLRGQNTLASCYDMLTSLSYA